MLNSIKAISLGGHDLGLVLEIINDALTHRLPQSVPNRTVWFEVVTSMSSCPANRGEMVSTSF